MTFVEIDMLIAAMKANGVTRLDWDHLGKGSRLRLTLPLNADAPLATAQANPTKLAVISPTIGTFVSLGAEDGLPPLDVSAVVQAGEALGYIAQGPVLHLLISPCCGTIAGDLPEGGQVFGYGDAVMHLTGNT